MTEENWNKFYTPLDIANDIVKNIPENFTPNQVIDICVGSGNFLKAASNRWDNVDLVGIDISLNLSARNIANKVYEFDALELRNLDSLKLTKRKLLLANPPFGKIPEKEKKQLSDKFKNLHEVAIKSNRIEALMLVSNLYLLDNEDLFGAILPENIFNSDNLSDFKKMFFDYFDVLFLGESMKYFKASEVKTRMFIGKYVGDKKTLFQIKQKKKPTCSIKVLRGIDNSKLLNINTYGSDVTEVMHFSNSEGKQMLKRFISNSYSKKFKIEKNDVLISRVGRSSGKIHNVKNDFIGKYFSDYFYLIKDFKDLANDNQLAKMEENLLQKTKGLTATYICKEDIMIEIEKIIESHY